MAQQHDLVDSGFNTGRFVEYTMLLTRVALFDELLARHAPDMGQDYTAYRNHCYRVMNFCAALARSEPDLIEKLAITAAFHDLGIWTDHTFDYLPPSERLAQSYLAQAGQTFWELEITAMIHEHHKLTRYQGGPSGLVEAFRQADWVDVSHGLLRFGLPGSLLREVFAVFPNAGFHRRLLQLSCRRLLSHPLSPLPMFRL
ncbi:HD domain-containing protein [Chitinimonas naiadis]